MSFLAALPLIGGGISAFGQVNESQQRQWALEDEAIVAEKNARIARETGAYNAKRHELESNQVLGTIKANVGASGIDSDSGNVLDILRQSAVNSELDRQNILRGAELNARNYDMRAAGARLGAKQVKNATGLNVFSTLFGAGAKSMERGSGGNGKIKDTEVSNTFSSTGGGATQQRSDYFG